MEETMGKKAIRKEIDAKNKLLKRIRGMSRKARVWQLKSEGVKNARKKKKYRATATRFLRELSRLEPQARKLMQELDARLGGTAASSKEEGKVLSEQLQREKEALDQISRELNDLEAKLKEGKEEPKGEPAAPAIREKAEKKTRGVKGKKRAAAVKETETEESKPSPRKSEEAEGEEGVRKQGQDNPDL